MNGIITYYLIFCFISVLTATIIEVIIYLYKRHKEKTFVTRYRIEEDVYKIDRNINGEVVKTYSYFVICRVISPLESWYLDFRIKNKVFYVYQFHSREYAEKFFSKEEAANRVNDMLANPDKYILDE